MTNMELIDKYVDARLKWWREGDDDWLITCDNLLEEMRRRGMIDE